MYSGTHALKIETPHTKSSGFPESTSQIPYGKIELSASVFVILLQGRYTYHFVIELQDFWSGSSLGMFTPNNPIILPAGPATPTCPLRLSSKFCTRLKSTSTSSSSPGSSALTCSS